MYCYTQSPQPCNRPLLTHNSAGDFWTPTGKSGPVSCGVTAPFSWVFVHKVLFMCSKSLFFPVLCKVWPSMVGLMATSSKRTYAIPSLLHPSPFPCGSPLLTRTPQEMLKHSSVSVSVGSLGPGVHNVCLSPLITSGGNGV